MNTVNAKANKQTNKQANKQTNKQTNQPTNNQPNNQTNKQSSLSIIVYVTSLPTCPKTNHFVGLTHRKLLRVHLGEVNAVSTSTVLSSFQTPKTDDNSLLCKLIKFPSATGPRMQSWQKKVYEDIGIPELKKCNHPGGH